jgi:hypothetical protein
MNAEEALQSYGQARALQTPYDEFLAGDFVTATVTSGAGVGSGTVLISTSQSSMVKARLLGGEIMNNSADIATIEYRDGELGGASAPRLLGPIQIPANSERIISKEQTAGRYALSNLFLVVISGAVSQGLQVNQSFIREYTDVYE